MRPYLFLLVTIVFVILGTTCLKLSHGFTILLPTIGVIIFDVLLYTSFGQVLKYFDMSTAYALWNALGIGLIAIVGLFLFHEPFNAVKVISLILITIGCVGLQLA